MFLRSFFKFSLISSESSQRKSQVKHLIPSGLEIIDEVQGDFQFHKMIVKFSMMIAKLGMHSSVAHQECDYPHYGLHFVGPGKRSQLRLELLQSASTKPKTCSGNFEDIEPVFEPRA
jgi:hypothetical protein